jgi:uncharacterized surface protein with fasciclin (FAS1) repeats
MNKEALIRTAMRQKSKLLGILRISLMLGILGIILYSCTEQKYKEETDTTVNILGYLEQNPEQFSEFLRILEITDNDVFIGTYGTYTFFAPTNEAVAQYLQENGYSSVEDVPVAELEDLVRLHLIDEIVLTINFTDGKIQTPTMLGQYLTTGAISENGATNITVNKTSKITEGNIEVGNGIIHVVDRVLDKAVKTLTETIAADENLTLFNEAIKATGWDEKLDQPVTYDEDSIPSYVSVFAQTDMVFQEAGINSLADLKDKYSHTGDPTDPEDSLNLFVAYRVLPGLKYTADLVTTPAHITKAPNEIISVKMNRDTILLNEQTFQGVFEKGVAVDRDNSDITAVNGVLHKVKEHFDIILRFPTPVYFDVADQPEFRRLATVFRRPGNFQSFSPGELEDIQWGGGLPITYSAHAAGTREAQAYYGDWLEILRLRTGSSSWIEFKTPVIVKGQYKVWITFRTNGRASVKQAYFNDKPLANLVDFREYRDTQAPPRVLESQGYKQSLAGDSWIFNSRFLGIINVESTGRHIFRLEALTGAGGPSWIDVIEFRPVEMDQLWPKLGGDGELVYEEDLEEGTEEE